MNWRVDQHVIISVIIWRVALQRLAQKWWEWSAVKVICLHNVEFTYVLTPFSSSFFGWSLWYATCCWGCTQGVVTNANTGTVLVNLTSPYSVCSVCRRVAQQLDQRNRFAKMIYFRQHEQYCILLVMLVPDDAYKVPTNECRQQIELPDPQYLFADPAVLFELSRIASEVQSCSNVLEA